MSNQVATFDNTVGILVKAFLEGTLERAECAACACGNIVADACGYKIIKTPEHLLSKGRFYELSFLRPDGHIIPPSWQFRDDEKFEDGPIVRSGNHEMRATGYSSNELTLIEYAFEGWEKPGISLDRFKHQNTGDREFDGLMRVVEALADIHGIDLTAAEVAKQLFVRA